MDLKPAGRLWSPQPPAATVRSGRDPAVPAVTRGYAFLDIGHLDAAQIVLGKLVTRGVHVDAEDARPVQPEDLLLHRARERRIFVLLDQRLGNLEAAERVDLPLRRAVPDGVCPPQHVVGTEGADKLPKQVG